MRPPSEHAEKGPQTPASLIKTRLDLFLSSCQLGNTLAALALAGVAATSGYSFRFSDGSFSLHAPFWITWPRGMAMVCMINAVAGSHSQ